MNRTRLADLIDYPATFLDDPDPRVRRLAASSCAGQIAEPGVVAALTKTLDADPDPFTRAEAAEVLALAGPGVAEPLMRNRSADSVEVTEAVATALGEVESSAAVPWLIEKATGRDDRLVREAAVAALGAIGESSAESVLLDLVASGPPQIRRRAVVALTAYDGEAVEAAIEAALTDRNPMVREVAEMIMGRPIAEGSSG